MKPHRIRMTHNLLLNYGLYRKMEVFVSGTLFESKPNDHLATATCVVGGNHSLPQR